MIYHDQAAAIYGWMIGIIIWPRQTPLGIFLHAQHVFIVIQKTKSSETTVPKLLSALAVISDAQGRTDRTTRTELSKVICAEAALRLKT